jgi:hypothetical protein
MGGVFAYIHNQPMSFAQKLVQTRVWAQGLTLASLLGMAAITQIPSAGDKLLRARDQSADHSWQDFIGDSSSEPSGKPAKPSSSSSSSSKNSASGSSSPQSSSSSSDKDSKKETSGSASSGDSNKNSAGKSSITEISSSKASSHAEKASGSSDTNADSSGKSSRSAHPNVSLRSETMWPQHRLTDSTLPEQAKNEKAQPTKAPASQTGEKAGYAGNN